ncbi:hypothetical protein [Thermosporothrix hazakensis]|jgi:hypothetical protein|uniref:hypothetical protein n=1 Tax=Thermosporothrix hazakensis TaxID=644383 RepID=UPI0010F8998F|nr:hypothetical protein [Thermosporothrix hazakensis]
MKSGKINGVNASQRYCTTDSRERERLLPVLMNQPSGMGDKARLPAPFCDCSVFDIEDILYFCYRKSGNLPDQSMIEESEVKVNE